MPNIPEYTAPRAQMSGVASFHASSSGADAIAQAGRTAGSLASASGHMLADSISSVTNAVAEAADDHYSRRQALDAGTEGLALYNQLNGEWNTRRNTADPRDPTVATKFNDEVLKPALDAFNQKYSATRAGQEATANFQRRMVDHFGQVQVADSGVAAAQAAEQDMIGLSNNGATVLMRDPTALDFVNGHVVDTMKTYLRANPGISSEHQAHLEDITQNVLRTNTIAAAHGMAMANPQAALKAFRDDGFGSDNLTGADRSMLVNYAEGQVREAAAMEQRQKVEERRKDEDATNTGASQAYAQHFDTASGQWVNLTGFASDLKQLAFDHPTTAGPTVKAGLDMVERLTKEAKGEPLPIADPATHEDFTRRMLLPAGDPNHLSLAEVYGARAVGRLTDKQNSFFQAAVTDLPKDPVKLEALKELNKFQEGNKSSITASNPLTGSRFPMQDQRFYQFQTDTAAEFDRVYKAGGDWKSLLNPSSPSYLGKQLGTYQLSNKEGLQTLKSQYNIDTVPQGVATPVPNPFGAAATRKPGESIADFEKRKGAK